MEYVVIFTVGLAIFALGGRVRTAFLYFMFTCCLDVLAFGRVYEGLPHFAMWTLNSYLFAIAIARDAREGSVGVIGRVYAWARN